MDLKFEAVHINGLHRATKETAESQRGSQTAAWANHSLRWGSTLHTGWAENFASWTHLVSGQTALQTLIPVNGLRVKEGHIKIWTWRVPNDQYQPDLVFLLSTTGYLLCLLLCLLNRTQKSKLLSCRSTLNTPFNCFNCPKADQTFKFEQLFHPQFTQSSILYVRLVNC